MPLLQIEDDGFRLDGEPFRILSGGLHYFRVHPGLWRDRLHKARLMGLNTVETYVPWNLHQPRPDEFRMDGGLDLPRFLDLAAAEGLHVLLRPGPYICAEWEGGGGLPSWLLADPAMRLRSRDPNFLAAVDDYFRRLLPPAARPARQPGRAGARRTGGERVRGVRRRHRLPGTPRRLPAPPRRRRPALHL
ncbi:hypothetical protein GCM10020254_03440 [Streptomyces goshikiensis]